MANAAGAAPGGHRNAFWGFLSLPGVAWLAALFVVPFYAVAAVAFGKIDPILRTADPVWNPSKWDFSAMNKVLDRVFDPNDLGKTFLRTFAYVGGALALCCIIGYPVAYYCARHAGRWRGLLLALLVLPFWISYLMRMLAWVNLLQPDGYVNRIIGWLHLPGEHNWLNGDWPAVVIGLTYGYIPFFILPLYASLDRMDKSFLEAARDLGASPFRTFLHVTLPLSKTGILGGCVLVALPMFGDYYTPNIVSGAPTTSMIGNQIDLYFHGGPQPTIGAALTLILSFFLVVLMAYYMVTVARATKEQQA